MSQTPSSDPRAHVLGPGEQVGPYQVLEQIGAGGSGIVFKARDPLLDRFVAIKQIRLEPGPDAASLRRQIKREAEAQKLAAEADPRHLVRLIDVVDNERGLFLLMEYIDGPSLEQVLVQLAAPMDLKQAVGIMAATALALRTIHAQGLIHRDLKPSNILLPRSGGLKVADFGLAAATAQQRAMSAGSVRYMAPELLRGEPADGRADLYALGLIAYQMIAGRPQFEEVFRMILRDQRHQAMRWVKWHTNPRATVPPLSELRPETPVVLSELVSRLMAKELQQRIPSAEDLLQAIGRHLLGAAPAVAGAVADPAIEANQALVPAGMLTRAQETGVTDVAGAPALITTAVGDEHTAPLPRRFGWPLALAASLAILVPLGAGAVWYQVHQQQSRQAAIVQQAEEVLGQARLAYQEGRFDEAKGLYQSVAEQWPAESAVGRRARGGVLAAQGRIDLDAGQYDAAVEAFERLDALGVMDRQRVRDLIDEAHRRSAFAQAMSQIEQAIADQQFAQARQELRSWRDLDLTELEEQKLGELAAVLEDQQARLEQQQVLAQAEALVEAGLRDRAIELLGAAIQRSPSLELQARHDQLVAEREHEAALLRASTAEAAGRLEEAAAAYAEALQARPDDAVAQKLAELQSRMALEQGLRELAAGNLPAAEAALIRSLGYQDNARAREALSQIQSTNRASVFLQAGDQAMAQGDYETAVKQYDNALALSDDPPLRAKRDEAMFRWQMTRSFEALRTGHVEQAKEALDQLASMRPQDPTLTAAMAELAAYQEYWGHIQAGDEARARSDFGEATRQYRMALEVLDTPQVRQRLDETEFAKLLAQARGYIAIEEYASARAMLQIAAKIRSSPEIEELQAEIGRRLTRERSPR